MVPFSSRHFRLAGSKGFNPMALVTGVTGAKAPLR